MKRRIFVGSSTESLAKAQAVCEVLGSVEDTECVIWSEIFEPGYLTFEALEAMLLRCCAAVFIASPDDESVIRDTRVKCPRSNVILEFGLVAGRLGRHSIALCRYGGATLPSDLKGLTVIEMDSGEQPVDPVVKSKAEEALRIWGSRLIATADTIPRTDIVHGYTGRWDFKLRLDKWRDLPIVSPSYSQVNGSADLVIAASGQTGSGFAHGRLFFKLCGPGPELSNMFQGEYHTAHEITNAFCHPDGSLEFVTQAFVLQRINGIGTPPPQLAGMDLLPEPWSSLWILHPAADPRTLEGTVHTEGTGISQGTARATKVGGPQ